MVFDFSCEQGGLSVKEERCPIVFGFEFDELVGVICGDLGGL